MTIRVGTVLYGFCGGAFSRDSYGSKRVEAMGADWVVVRDEWGRPEFADCSPDTLEQYTVADEDEDSW